MTTELDREARLEREIRAAFAEVVPRQADPGLATSIRATLARTPVVQASPRPLFGRSTMAAAVLVAVVLVIVAVPLIGQLRESAPSTNPGLIVGASPSAGPSASPSPRASSWRPAPARLIPVHKDMFGDVEVEQARLVTDTVGWVKYGWALYRTADGGATWSEVALPHAGEYGLTIVDAETVFVEYRSLPVSIWGTDDGGLTWSRATFDKVYADMYLTLSFRTPLIGSASFFDDKPGQVHVFQTNDGGRTWVGPFDAKLPDGQVKTNPYRGGVLSLNAGKADNKPFNDRLWLTTDGGQTWPKRPFPIDQVAPAGTLKWVIGTPLVDGYGRIVLPIAVDGGPNALYESADDGQTWHLINAWPEPTFADFAWQALSETDWVLSTQDGSEFWSTTDGGASWRQVLGPGSLWEFSTSWASTDHGWALHGCPGNRPPAYRPSNLGPDPYCDGTGLKSVLFETTDGGHTWTKIGG